MVHKQFCNGECIHLALVIPGLLFLFLLVQPMQLLQQPEPLITMAAVAHSLANMYQTFLTQVLELAHMILVMAMLDFGGWPFAKLNCNGDIGAVITKQARQ